MRIPFLLVAITLVVLSVSAINDTSLSSTERSVAATVGSPLFLPPGSMTVQGVTRFSSAYTALTKCGSGMTKKEERAAEKHGTDIPTRCRGLDGYYVDVSYSACASNIIVAKGETSIPLGIQELNFKQKNVEWRLANGKPFAVIMRLYEYGGTDPCTSGGKITGESLIVKGLEGYEQINEEVNVKGAPNANLKARELADKGYAQPKVTKPDK